MPPIPKSKQLDYRGKKNKKEKPKGCKTEAPVQSFCDNLLENLRIHFFRIPDRLWWWMKMKEFVHAHNKVSKNIHWIEAVVS